MFKICVALIHRTELAFPSYENKKKLFFKDFANIMSNIYLQFRNLGTAILKEYLSVSTG